MIRFGTMFLRMYYRYFCSSNYWMQCSKNRREGYSKGSGMENRWVQAAASMMLRLDGLCSQKIAVRWFTLPLKWTSLKGLSMASRWDVHGCPTNALFMIHCREKFHGRTELPWARYQLHEPTRVRRTSFWTKLLASCPWRTDVQFWLIINFVSWWSLTFFSLIFFIRHASILHLSSFIFCDRSAVLFLARFRFFWLTYDYMILYGYIGFIRFYTYHHNNML